MGRSFALAIVIVALFSAPLSASAQLKANDQCLPGNYAYDWRTTRPPCDTTNEAAKCRLNSPCYEEVHGVRAVVGICTAEKFCSTISVRICDGAGECAWRTPEKQNLLPPTHAPDTQVVAPPTLQPGESLLESALERILGTEPLTPPSMSVDEASARLQAAKERLATDVNNFGENFDRVREAEADLQLARRLENNPTPSLRDYLRGVVAPRLTPEEFLPSGEPLSPQPSRQRWYDVGSTFGAPYEVADAPGVLNDGPPIPLTVVTDAARALEQNLRDWVLIGQKEIVETINNWRATEIESPWTTPVVPGMEIPQQPTWQLRYALEFESVSDAVSTAIRCAAGFGCPEPVPVSEELPPLELLPPSPLEPLKLLPPTQAPRSGETLRDGIEKWQGQPGAPIGIIDERGRLWGFQEPDREDVIRVDSEEGKRIALALGCSDACYEAAAEEAKSVRLSPEERTPIIPTPERVPPVTPTAPEPPAEAPRVPPNAEKTRPAPTTNPVPRISTSPFFTGPLQQIGNLFPTAVPNIGNVIPALLNLLSSVLQWLNNTPQMPPTTPTTQPTVVTQPILSLVANPSSVTQGGRTTLSWASINWKNGASVTCTISQVGISVGSGGAVGTLVSSPLSTSTTFTARCEDGVASRVEKSYRLEVK